MNTIVVVVLFLSALWTTSESLALFSTTAAVATAAIAGKTISIPTLAALGVGALAVIKGIILKRHLRRRQGRDVTSMETEEDMAVEIAMAKQMDSAGCIAKLLCEIESMPADELSPSMASFKAAFEDNEVLQTSRGVYDLAISVGSKFAKQMPKACSALFEKCALSRNELILMLDSTFSC